MLEQSTVSSPQSASAAVPGKHPKVAAYVINLDRSVDRWQHIRDQALQFGVNVERVAAVDGSQVNAHQYSDYNYEAFIRANGRPMLPEEYGCYLAHLKALRAFLAGDAESAVILEDDVDLQSDLVVRAAAISVVAQFADVIKLLNHRAIGFRPIARSGFGDIVGKCFFGPQGSAACYLVTREGAENLVVALREIKFPFDVALERGWETGIRVYSVKNNVLKLSARSRESQIADRARYASIKLRGYRRIQTHLFRALEFIRRAIYSLT